MTDKHLPPNSLHGTSLPDAHKEDKISIPAAHQAVAIAALQAHLRDLRAKQTSDESIAHSEQEQRALLIEINSALELLHHLGAQEAPAQP